MRQEQLQAANRLSATEAAHRIAAGRLTSVELVDACLERIAAREPAVRAWAYLDRETALREAQARDAETPRGPLHGVPLAIKDVVDVDGMPSGMGSPIYDGYRPPADAACVAAARAAGAVILGKTVTAEFAGITPGATTHPLDASRTPGGSSSGSAAAVADFMVPLAVGTQTGGSILRPAAFCGAVGFKPSFGTVNRAGLKPAAESLDTIGVIARTVADVDLFWRILVGRPAGALRAADKPPRFALARTHHWPRAAPEMQAAVEATASAFRARGAIVDELAWPDGLSELSKARAVTNNYERARALGWEWANHRDRISPQLAKVLEDGWAQPFDAYLAALRTAEEGRLVLVAAMGDADALLTPAANGVAPEGLASTGDTSFQELWTILHLPAISLPLATGASGLPLGIQLVGRRHDDARLLRTAAWAMDGTADHAARATGQDN